MLPFYNELFSSSFFYANQNMDEESISVTFAKSILYSLP